MVVTTRDPLVAFPLSTRCEWKCPVYQSPMERSQPCWSCRDHQHISPGQCRTRLTGWWCILWHDTTSSFHGVGVAASALTVGEDQTTADGKTVRLTHVIRPALAQPRAPGASYLATPETSDVSAASASETDPGTTTDATEVAESDGESVADETFHTAQDTSFTSLSERFGVDEEDTEDELSSHLGDLNLQRSLSHSSSAYASSEGGFSEASALDDRPWQLDSPVATQFPLPPIKNSTRRPDVLDKPTFFEYLFE